jgi:hypothetical protein
VAAVQIAVVMGLGIDGEEDACAQAFFHQGLILLVRTGAPDHLVWLG